MPAAVWPLALPMIAPMITDTMNISKKLHAGCGEPVIGSFALREQGVSEASNRVAFLLVALLFLTHPLSERDVVFDITKIICHCFSMQGRILPVKAFWTTLGRPAI